MTIEIHTPEVQRRFREEIQSGNFHDMDELLLKALDALREKEASSGSHLDILHSRRSNHVAVQRMIQFSKENTVRLPLGETVEDLVRESHRY
jgi:Arc/MetJ-type ribon-helix-helix transcriptional regulator